MISEKIRNALDEKSVPYRILEFDMPFESTFHAAEMIETPVENIAKTLVFQATFGTLVLITSGIAKIDNRKFKERFEFRPLMLKPDELKELTGFEPGCVSPIGIASDSIQVYMDITLDQLTVKQVYPSGGTDNCAIEILADDLYMAAECKDMVDVCK